MNVYLLEVYPEYKNGEISQAWNGIIFSTMLGACKYGERLHRKFGHKYRVLRCYVMRNHPYSIF